MSILFKFFGVFFIFMLFGGCLSFFTGKVIEDTDDYFICWATSIIYYTIIIVGIMGHFGYFNQ